MPTEETVLHTAPVERIGRHEWTLQVYIHPCYRHGARYRWRRVGEIVGRDAREWPTYDSNNGVTGGLPRRLSRYVQRHRGAIEAALEGATPCSPTQGDLFDPVPA
ncbi:MAG: hypothetical protein WAU60_14595 [Candidatus Competibacter denitrificans]|jgi:hypothetical protein